MTAQTPEQAIHHLRGTLAPVEVRERPGILTAMHFIGGAENATRIIDWVLLNNGTASWTEAYDGFTVHADADSPSQFVPGANEHIKVRTALGLVRIYTGWWVVQDSEGKFRAVAPGPFRRDYEFIRPATTNQPTEVKERHHD